MISAHTATDQTVFTYQVDSRPQGVLTGHRTDDYFVLEHVIVFPGAEPSTLLRMLYAGIREAWERGYTAIIYHLPHAFEHTPTLERVGERLGFAEYAQEEDCRWFIRWK